MSQWGPRLDWRHLQNWLPGFLGVAAAVLLVAIAAYSPTQNNSKQAQLPPSQSAALPTKVQAGANPTPSPPAAPQTSSIGADATKAPPTVAAVATTGDAAKPAPMHHPMVEAQAVAAPAAVQGSSKPDKESAKAAAAADAANPPSDAIAGRQVFKKCQVCHSLEPGKTILGPSLAGIVGRKSGAEAGFSYSPALKQASLTWDAATLDAYLTDPQKVVPGNRMPFPGLRTDRDRKDVVAFLAASASPAAAPSAAKTASAPTASAPQAKSDTAAAYI